MPIPVTSIYYFNTTSFSGTTFGEISSTAPPTTNTTTNGWNVGQNNPSLFCEMNHNLEVIRTSTQWLASPTSSIPNQNAGGSGRGNCWVMGPFNGEFLSGDWAVTMSYRAVSNASTHTNRIIHRIWTSPTVSGQTSSLVSPTFFSSSIGTISSTTVRVPFTSSITLPNLNLRNEYIFFQTYCSVITAAGNNNADMDITLGTMSMITPTQFVSHSKQGMVFLDQDI